VERTRDALKILFPLIPGPNRKLAEDYGVFNPRWNYAIATLVVDKTGVVRFEHIAANDEDRPNAAKVIEVLRGLR
jgi:peroxiredoxin